MLIHQPHGGASGQAVDIEIQAKEIIRMREALDSIVAYTGQDVDKVAATGPRLHHEATEASRDYGIVDEVITNRELASVGVPAGVSWASTCRTGPEGTRGQVR